VRKSLVLPDVMALVMEPDLAPISATSLRVIRLMGRDDSATAVAHLPAAGANERFTRAVMWEATILESESDRLPSHLRVHTS
jgi:hypothetical protein